MTKGYQPFYFKWSEFDTTDFQNPHQKVRGSGKEHMDQKLVMMLDDLREFCGFPIIINSGYRSPEWNAIVSGTGHDGPHTTGKAVDILCSGHKADKIMEGAYKFGFTGKGIKQKGEHGKRFIHLDILTADETNGLRPWVWSY